MQGRGGRRWLICLEDHEYTTAKRRWNGRTSEVVETFSVECPDPYLHLRLPAAEEVDDVAEIWGCTLLELIGGHGWVESFSRSLT